MKKSKLFVRILAIILALAMIVGSAFYLVYIIAPASLNTYAMDADDEARLDNLKETIRLIEENYKDKVDTKALIDTAYAGVIDFLDIWSTYYSSAEERDLFSNQLTTENYSGVGMTLVEYDGKIYVCELNPKGPAYAAGVKPGDIVIGINGGGVKTSTASQVADRLRGTAGSTVRVKFQRGDEIINVSLKRKALTAANVCAKVFDKETGAEISDILDLSKKDKLTGYIQIKEFDEGTTKDFETELQIFKASGIKDLIIDLRDNPGGYMGEAMDCIDNFLKKGDKLVSYTRQGKEIEKELVLEDGQYKMNMVLLVNGDSASACDAFAAIFKDYKLGKIVGTTTYGKGVAQEMFDLGDGSFMKLTTCYFLSPKGRAIHGIGTTPDIEVKCEKSLTEIAIFGLPDPQLNKALELLAK